MHDLEYLGIAYPCQNNSIVVVAHSSHNANTGDKSKHYEDRGHDKHSYDDSEHSRSSVLHRERRCNRHLAYGTSSRVRIMNYRSDCSTR